MIVLGVNSVFHESSAAVVVDGRLVAAAEEERFNRRKHAKPADVDNAHVLPEQAIRFCLETAGVTAADVDVVAYSYDPALRRERFAEDDLSLPGGWGSRDGEDAFLGSLDRVPAALAELGLTAPVRWVRHHLAHAASAYYTSCPPDAAVVVVDGIGEDAATVLYGGVDGELRLLEEIGYPHSIGFLWEKLSSFLGFSEYDACKVMGLAGYGDPAVYADAFAKFVALDGDAYRMDLDVLRYRLPDTAALAELLGPARRPGEPLEQRHSDIAAALQDVTNTIMMALLERAHRLHPSRVVGLAGGVALNCTTNYLLKEHGPFEEIHIPSAPHDGGTAIGGALLVAWEGRTGWPVQADPYVGPAPSDAEVAAAVGAAGLDARRSDDVCGEVARMLADGLIVGWFQDRMEMGPRALGNRSLLADPRNPEMREILNHKVKHREHFRPFAPSVLEEHAADWFALGRPSPAYELMLFAPPVHPDKLDRIPAVVHADGTARVQTVSRRAAPRYHELISRFHALTGVPMLLNTSFNDSEPIVCTPADAVRTFTSTRIDVLVIGDLVMTRPAAEPVAAEPAELVGEVS